MLKKNEIEKYVSELRSYNDLSNGKYLRNWRRYNSSPNASLYDIRYDKILGYHQYSNYQEDDSVLPPQINVIKSCVDTLVSKLSQTKVRPFFNTVNGTFKTNQTVKAAQIYFDQYFDLQRVSKKISQAFKMACIFDRGWIYINEDTKNIETILPFQVFVRPSEMTYGKLTKCYIERKDYPKSLLPENLKKEAKTDFVTFGIFYDSITRTKSYQVSNGKCYIEETISDEIPLVSIGYEDSLIGRSCLSVVDILFGIQSEIDLIATKIKDCATLSPALTFFVPEGSTIKASALNNKVGNVLTYASNPNMTSGVPVSASTPNFIDNQYFALLESLKNTAYEMVGISQLSAQSKKPSGLDSGIALRTMEDLESDRFNTQLNDVINVFTKIAQICVKTFNPEEDILPESNTRPNVKWKDIVNEWDNFKIQFSGADALSKDPSTKLQQLQMLAQAGMLPASRIPTLLEIPDIQEGYSLATNAINAVNSFIEEIINLKEDEDYEIPNYLPVEMLKEEVINTQLSLRASNFKLNEKDINKLSFLYQKIMELETLTLDEQEEAKKAKELDLKNNMVSNVDLDVRTNQNGNVY